MDVVYGASGVTLASRAPTGIIAYLARFLQGHTESGHMARRKKDTKASREKRIVVHIVRGRLAGLRRIVGHLVLKGDEEFPPRYDNVPIADGATGSVIHAGTYPRYILYREWKQPTSGKLNQFNPAQI